MGHREQLLEGAKRCLIERGYARTTARDIVAASGTNLASIGYHFGSKEALLNAAIVEGFDEFGQRLQRLLSDEGSAPPAERLQAAWSRMIESFVAERPLWAASVEAFLHTERVPELGEQFAAGYESARWDFPAMLLGPVAGALPPERRRAAGSALLAVMVGLMLQWLLDPERAPSAGELADGLRAVADLTADADG